MFRLDIAAGDRSEFVEAAEFSYALGERATGRVRLTDGYLPARFAPMTSYDKDGSSPFFGGVVLSRHVAGVAEGNVDDQADLDCADFAAYEDWCFVTLSYTSDQALEDVIDDIVTQELAQHGITYTPAATGITVAAFTVRNKKVSELIRELLEKTNRLRRYEPDGELLLVVPGAEAAPFEITDANPNCSDLAWDDNRVVPGNKVILTCGPTGTGKATQVWTADGVETSWVTDLPAADPAPILVEVDPPGAPTPYLATVGPGGQFEWDRDTHTLSLGTHALPAAGTTLTLGPTAAFPNPDLGYTALYPFDVVRDTGATPVITHRFARTDITEYGPAVETADALLEQVDQDPPEITVTTIEDGLKVGQLLTVNLTTSRGAIAGDFLITALDIRLVRGDSVAQDDYWEYVARAVRSTTFQGSDLSKVREIFGGGSAASSSVVLSGASVSGSGVSGSGTTGAVPKFTTQTALGDSIISESGSTVTVTGALTVTGKATFPVGASAPRITGASGGNFLELVSTGTGATTWIEYLDTSGRVAWFNGSDRMRLSTTGLTVLGLLSATGFGNHDLTAGGAGGNNLLVRNTTAGATNFAALALGNDNDGNVTGLYGLSSTYATSEIWFASGSVLRSAGVGGLSVAASHASGDVRLYWAAATTPKLHGTANTFKPGTTRVMNLGALDAKYLTLYAEELNVQTLVAREVISTIGGRILVGPTTALAEALTAGSGVDLVKVKHNDLWNNEVVYLQAAGSIEYMRVGTWGDIAAVDVTGNWFEFTGDFTPYYIPGRGFVVRGSTGNDGQWVVSTSSYNGGTNRTRVTVTGDITNGTVDGYSAYLDWDVNGAAVYAYRMLRDLDGSGPNAWNAGDAVFNTGDTGDGFIDIYSQRGIKAATEVGPTIVGNVRLSSTVTDWAPRWAIGNLRGLYGYSVDTYGVAFGNVAAANMLITASDGILIRHGTTNKITLDPSGNASFTGAITAASGTIGGFTIIANYLFSGASGATRVVMSSDGVDAFWAGAVNAVDAPFRVTAGGALTATSATIEGDITATAGEIGGWTINTTSLTGGNATLASSGNLTLGTGDDVVRLSADDATYRLWIGDATAGDAPFRVTKAGVLTATGANITGSIFATTGELTDLEINGTLTIDTGGEIVAGGVKMTSAGFSVNTTDITIDGTNGIVIGSGAATGAKRIEIGGKALYGSGSRFFMTTGLTLDGTVISNAVGGTPGGFQGSEFIVGDVLEFVNMPTDTGTAVIWDAGTGELRKDSSSLRYKERVRAWAPVDPLAAIRVAAPIQFDFRGGTRDVVGFAAEQLHAIAPELVNLDREGQPESVRLQTLSAHLWVALKALDARLSALEAGRP